MSVANEQPAADTRPILAPTGNRVSVYEDQRRKRETAKKPAAEKAKKVISQSPAKSVAAATAVVLVRRNVSADSSSDSSSSSSVSSSSGTNVKSGKSLSSRRTKFSNGVDKSEETGAEGVEALITLSPAFPPPIKRCDWITPNSEPLYICFHDEEWGTPVHDDIKLFELLILSQALAELSWPLILIKRPIFRKVFDEFNPKSVANLDHPERLVSMRVHGSKLLSEQKLRAIVENAKQLLMIQQEFGSFSNYLWRFVSHKPIKTGFRHARQLPAKTPKSELVSKDLMHRGFCCVGPTVVYSFMQVSGIVNDHLITCFRYNNECRKIPETPSKQGSTTTT